MDRALRLSKLICIFFFSSSVYFGPVLASTNHQWNCLLTFLVDWLLLSKQLLNFLSSLSCHPYYLIQTIRCSDRQDEAFSHDVLIENEVSILCYFFFFLFSRVFLMLRAKLKGMVLYLALVNHRKFQRKFAVASGSAAHSKLVWLKTVCFLKTTFVESCSKVNVLANIEKNILFMNHCIKLLNSVDSLMAHQHWSVPKSLPTFITYISFIPRMDSLVLNKGWAPFEGLATVITLVGFFSTVNSLMSDEVWVQTEGFSTLSAFIGFLSAVYPLMGDQLWALLESFPTFSALIGSLSCMNSLVSNKLWALAEGFPTLITLIGFLTSVNSLMYN